MPSQPRVESLVILIPVYNDWDAVGKLIPLINASIADLSLSVRLLLVNDGSSQPCPDSFCAEGFSDLSGIDVLHLRCNLGSQRALAVGLSHLGGLPGSDAVLVMDGDGEDSPADIPRLVSKYRETGGHSVVFAERRRRSESMAFRACYFLYRVCHRLLTGRAVRVGNFSLIPRKLLDALVVVPDLWNHYAASVYKAQLPTSYVPANRGQRLAGSSHMNFVKLVTHGLSAISVFSELAGVRLLISCGVLCLFSLVGLVIIIVQALTSSAGFPWGAALASSMLLLLFLQMGLYALLACFITMGSRTTSLFIPQRDHVHFINRRETLFGDHE